MQTDNSQDHTLSKVLLEIQLTMRNFSTTFYNT